MAVHDSHRDKRNVLLALMLVTITAGLFFVYQNLLRGAAWIAALEIAFIVYSLILIPVVRRTSNLQPWALAYVLPWVCTMFAILASPGISMTVFIWPLLLPLILHFLFGRRLGLMLSVVSLAVVVGIAWSRFGLPEGPDERVFAGNLVLAAVLILLLAHVYERGRARTEKHLQELATTDALTQVPNRTLLPETFKRFSSLARRRNASLSLLLMDLDHFKQINDRYGHAVGDQVLVEFAEMLRQRMRGADFLCRFGGEEFLALLPETDRQQASALAEALRKKLQETEIGPSGHDISLTISMGVGELDTDAHDLDGLLRVADERLYRAKKQGRNRVVSSSADGG